MKENIEKEKELLKKAFYFFAKNSAHIDVMKGIELELVYFILLPYTQAMPKSKKLDFHENVDRSNTKSKVLGLVESADELIEICMHE